MHIAESGAFVGHFKAFTLWIVPLYRNQGFGPFVKNGFRAFHRAKMSREDTQNKHNKLEFSSKNQIE